MGVRTVRGAAGPPRWARDLVGVAASVLVVAPGAPDALCAQERFAFAEPHMGTTFRIVLYAEDAPTAQGAARAAFAVVGRLDSLLSDYRPESELSRLGRAGVGEASRVSRETWDVLRLATSWAERTGGSFDPTVGPLTRLWRWSARRGELPDAGRLAAARAAVGAHFLVVDEAAPLVRLARAGMALDVGGIAKGYAADAALRSLAGRGVEAAMVDAGGDLALGAPPPGRAGWRVILPDGLVVERARAGVATSGDTFGYVEIEGVRYAHVVDPRSGLGVVDAPVVTVVAPDAATADVLASALTVMGAEEGAALVASVPGAAARVSGRAGWESATFTGPGGRPPRETGR